MLKPEILFFLGLIVIQTVSVWGIADKAAYYIQNADDKLCITEGPVLENDSVSLFQTGILVTSNCSENNLDQQWVIRMKVENHVLIYDLRSFNSKTLNKKLNAQVRGEFLHYFPNLVKIYGNETNGNGQETLYSLYDIKIKKCYESLGENHVLYLAKCDHNNISQLWNLTIVNQHPAAGTICTSFWSCNH